MRNLGHPGERVDALAVVPVAVSGNEHFGFDLAKAVEHALHAEIGRAGRPDGTDAGGREHRHHGLRQIGEISRNAVARLHAGGAQRLRQARNTCIQLRVRQALFDLVLTPEDHRIRAVAPAQQILGEIEARIRKPLGARHSIAVHQHALTADRSLHARVLPQ